MDKYFNPRSPRGGATSSVVFFGLNFSTFQSTLPTRGSDECAEQIQREREGFQSTLPTRGSDIPAADVVEVVRCISIHAPHEGERHYSGGQDGWLTANFNPRSPRGGATLGRREADAQAGEFQSTLPTRGSDL